MFTKSKVYGVVCTKGGVGKTTKTANLGAILADMGQRVLLIDADPQQSLSRLYSIKSPAPFGLSQVYRSASTVDCISTTYIANLDIILNDDPGSDGKIANFLRESMTHFQRLYVALQSLDYDYILIDTQGSKGNIQESVILAADILISPVRPQILDSREFIYGTVDLVNKFKPQPGFLSITGRPLPPIKVLINLWDRTTTAQEISDHLRCTFDKETDGQITVLNTVIPALKAYSEATGLGIPVHRHEIVRRGSTQSALNTMLNLVYELEPKLLGVTPQWNK